MSQKPTLYFIYGAPSAGKLTIAKQLSKEISLNLFHNHLTFNVAASIYPVWSDPFFRYCEELRVDGIKRAMQAGHSLIFTFCYTYPEDNPFVEQVMSTVEENGGEVKFIKLVTDKKTVISRVENKERGNFEKINKKEELEEFLNKYDVFTEIPYSKSFEISTTLNTPKESVDKIINQFQLK